MKKDVVITLTKDEYDQKVAELEALIAEIDVHYNFILNYTNDSKLINALINIKKGFTKILKELIIYEV
jgi:hypothetical protein